ncbi:unnamed protein product [Fraxinus pennsylvanica]|uniref:Uncharacterized protein n=1 Tax=Fraxinus pennsylvanica TaxID=56036 RepID=A0AAD2AG99_9LAMI|nr:unnamed protein product [Fraxinus pennsylvanica]
MKSTLASTAAKLNRVLSGPRNQFLSQRLASASTTGRRGDPAAHAVEPEEVDATEAVLDEKLRHLPEKELIKEPYVAPKSPTDSSPKLESTGVNERIDPITQQKRWNSSTIEDLNCAGLDGSPWPEDTREQSKEQMEDDREYLKHHKASPLSEIEIADTRKPITRATDGTVQDYAVGYDSEGVVLWRPEQIDTAEDSLRRAMEIFRENAIRGDPDSPHGRVDVLAGRVDLAGRAMVVGHVDGVRMDMVVGSPLVQLQCNDGVLREYLKHHKASPLSEIEIADTRKPITRATDGTVQDYAVGYDGEGVVLWRPEQIDTAEDSLRRAMEIFRENAIRGDPDSPHGRVLRALRGEYW